MNPGEILTVVALIFDHSVAASSFASKAPGLVELVIEARDNDSPTVNSSEIRQGEVNYILQHLCRVTSENG